MPLPQLHTAHDVASAMQVSEWWVREQAKKGRVSAVKVAGTWRFTDHQYTQLVELHTTTPGPRPELDVIPRRQPRTEPTALVLVPRLPRRASGQ